MSYTIKITEVTPNVTVSTTQTPIGVTVENQQFNVTTEQVRFNVVNTSTEVKFFSDATEIRIADLNKFFEGEWISGTEYARGSIVTYNYSLFLLKDFGTDALAKYNSTIDPNLDTDYWIRLVWHEAPFDHLDVTNTARFRGDVIMELPLDHLTVTNHISAGSLSVGGIDGDGLVINSTATFNGPVFVNNTATMEQLVLDKLRVAGIDYPEVTGEYGQVLITNGADKALWIDLSRLVYWQLSSDLNTNGYNIMSGKRGNGTSLPLTIGQNTTGELVNYIKFADTNHQIQYVSGQHVFQGPAVFSTGTNIGGDLRVGGVASVNTLTIRGGILNVMNTMNVDTLNINSSITVNNSTSRVKTYGEVHTYGPLYTDLSYNQHVNKLNEFFKPSNPGQFDDARLAEYENWTNNIRPSDIADPTIPALDEGVWVTDKTWWWQQARIASTSTIGMIKVGTGLTIDDQGYLNASGGGSGGTGDGYTGSRGYTGSQGPAGGYTGSRGSNGFTGSIGIGIQGDQGEMGYTGSQGVQGEPGEAAAIGYTGSQGIQGPSGGYTGSRGNIGYTGSFGFVGSQGNDGAYAGRGYTGSTGDLGYTGSVGTYSGELGQGLVTNGFPIEFSTLTNSPFVTISENGIRVKDRPYGTGFNDTYGTHDQDGVSEIILDSTATTVPSIIGNGNKIQLSSSSTYLTNQFLFGEDGYHTTINSLGGVNEALTQVELTKNGLKLTSNLDADYYTGVSNDVYDRNEITNSVINMSTSSVLISSSKAKRRLGIGTPYANNTSTINVHETVDITSSLTNVISPLTVFGTDNYNSVISVNEIINYDNNGAVQITQVQFGDQTIQRTAYEPDQGLLPG